MKSLTKNIKYIGNIITIIAIFFIIKKLFSYDIDINYFFNYKNIIILIICLILYIINVFISTYPWLKMVQIISKKKLPKFISVYVNVKSNLLKYIPGNVFQYIGKNELALRCNVTHKQVAMATIVDVIIMLLIAFILGGICIGKYFISIINTYFSIEYIFFFSVIAIIILIVCILIDYNKKKMILSIFKEIKSKQNIKNLLLCICYYCFQNVWAGVIYILVLLSVTQNRVDDISYILILGANIISGVIGFLTPGAPGGLGIREVIMLYITKGIFNESSIMLTSVIYRIITILGDIIAFFISSIMMRVKSLEYTDNQINY